MNRPARPNGFIMIEVLAALAIVSVSLLLLFDLKQTVHARQQKQLAQLAAAAQEANALAVLRRIDPWREGAGNARLDADTTLLWQPQTGFLLALLDEGYFPPVKIRAACSSRGVLPCAAAPRAYSVA